MQSCILIREMTSDDINLHAEKIYIDKYKSFAKNMSDDAAKKIAESLSSAYKCLLLNSVSKPYLVVRSNDNVKVGEFRIESENTRWYFSDFQIYEEYRNKGFAFQALLQLEKLAESLGVQEIVLYVKRENAAAIRLYEKVGFEKDAELSEHFVMKKRIDIVDAGFQHGRAQAIVVRGNRILMVKQCVDGEEYWIIPGGGREHGESPEQTALRELNEECGISGTIRRKTSEYYDTYEENDSCFFWTYLIDIGDQEPTLGYDPEFSSDKQVLRDIAWKTLDELSERDRAYLWSAGLISVKQFSNELKTWSRDVTPAPKK